MAKRKVIWTDDAKNQRKKILHHTRDQNPSGKLFREFKEGDEEMLKMTPEQRKNVMRGLEQVRNGEVSSHEDAMNEIKEWLREKRTQKKPI